MSRWLYWMVFGMFGAAGVHLAMVLLVPQLSQNDLTSRLSARQPANAMALLDRDSVRGMIRFSDDAAAYAACPFDLSDGPVGLVAPVTGTPLSIIFLGRGGSVFAALTDRAASGNIIQLRVATEEQLRILIDSEEATSSLGDLRIVSPDVTGVMLIKAMIARPSLRPAAEAALIPIRCGAV